MHFSYSVLSSNEEGVVVATAVVESFLLEPVKVSANAARAIRWPSSDPAPKPMPCTTVCPSVWAPIEEPGPVLSATA